MINLIMLIKNSDPIEQVEFRSKTLLPLVINMGYNLLIIIPKVVAHLKMNYEQHEQHEQAMLLKNF